MSLHPNNEMKIEYLFIIPKYQGKKIGATVMALIEKENKGITKWFLLTPYKDYRNHYFYEKLGYEKVGEIQPIEKSEFTLFQYEKIINTQPGVWARYVLLRSDSLKLAAQLNVINQKNECDRNKN